MYIFFHSALADTVKRIYIYIFFFIRYIYIYVLCIYIYITLTRATPFSLQLVSSVQAESSGPLFLLMLSFNVLSIFSLAHFTTFVLTYIEMVLENGRLKGRLIN